VLAIIALLIVALLVLYGRRRVAAVSALETLEQPAV